MKNLFFVAAGVLIAGCGTDPESQYVAGFNPPPVAAGYTRFLTPTTKGIAPGADLEMCQWVTGPASAPQDVLDFTGAQSATGHHAILYATTETQFPVGESHPCTEQDMLSISFVGAIGGEGASNLKVLPDGLFFRLPANQALMINSHWVNATDQTVDGQAVIDIKFAPASDQRQIADLFANGGVRFAATPGVTAYDVSCVLQQDFNFAVTFNHMHQYGMSAYTELIRGDGTKDMLVQDPTWAADQGFNPKYNKFSLAAPKVAHVGDTIHTHCEWQNTTTAPIMFPTEMCVGTGFYFPGHGQVACVDGAWPTK
jgi:hypothetical protein